MELTRLLADADPSTRKDVLITALLSSTAAVVLLQLINSASQVVAQHHLIPLRSMFLYLVAFALCYLGNRTSLLCSYELMEAALQKLRLRIAEKIGRAHLLEIDRLGRGELFVSLSEGTSHLSEVTPALVAGLQQGLLVIGCLIYIGSVSAAGFVVVGGVTVLAGLFFLRFHGSHRDLRRQQADNEARLQESLSSFVDGFKEVRLNYDKSNELHEDFRQKADENERLQRRLGEPWTSATLYSNLYLYKMLAILVFVLPAVVSNLNQTIIQLATATLFLFGPITTVVNVLPSLEQAESGLRELAALEARLDRALTDPSDPPPTLEPLQSISFLAATFRYFEGEEVTFTSGPWDLTVTPGQVLYLVGGNGSGKSTLLKMLTGLYPLASGQCLLNGQPAQPEQLGEYFSCVFADFHLFDRLYGLEQVEPEAVQALLLRMQLDQKVRYENGRFSSLNLSTGQRKRLALIAALLEDKPAYVFDEWAADQDKHFRDEFYQKILPELAARNKVVVVVTHDERYWPLANRIIRMDSGKIQ